MTARIAPARSVPFPDPLGYILKQQLLSRIAFGRRKCPANQSAIATSFSAIATPLITLHAFQVESYHELFKRAAVIGRVGTVMSTANVRREYGYVHHASIAYSAALSREKTGHKQ
ncbi:hypothetical protein ACVWZV_000937 [Bradyrhizobium sp. GM5.1]